MNLRPFISYAREDHETARRLSQDLRANEVTPWIDVEDLLGGQDWKQAITRAIAGSSHFIALLSTNSVNKQGYVQKELRQALDLLDTFPPGQAFVIPVRIDESAPRHEKLNDLHWIDLFPEYDDGLRRLLRSLRSVALASETAEHHSLDPDVSNKPPSSSPGRETDEEGFLMADTVTSLVLGRLQGRHRLRDLPFLLFENSYQHTWLVVTEREVACVLDDIEKPSSYDPFRWHCRHRHVWPVETEPDTPVTGLIHLGPEHREWLYSVRLHPDAALLRAKIERLVAEQDAALSRARAIYSSGADITRKGTEQTDSYIQGLSLLPKASIQDEIEKTRKAVDTKTCPQCATTWPNILNLTHCAKCLTRLPK
jgi:hypothetical protein